MKEAELMHGERLACISLLIRSLALAQNQRKPKLPQESQCILTIEARVSGREAPRYWRRRRNKAGIGGKVKFISIFEESSCGNDRQRQAEYF